jgi:hypothetical protein
MNHQNLRLLAVCAALTVPAVTSAPAWAQPGQAIDANTLTRQRQLFDQGNKLYDVGKLAEAEASYLEAWRLKKSFDVAGNLGNLEADLKHWQRAAEFISYAIREFPAGGKPGLRDELLRRLAEVQKQVGGVRLVINRPGAEVFVDGRSVGTTPLLDNVFLDPGPHQIEVRLDGYPSAQAAVNVVRGQTQEVALNLAARSGNKGVIIGGVVVFGVAAIATGIFGGLYASKGSSASTLAGMVPKGAGGGCPPGGTSAPGTCGDLTSALNSQATFGSVAIGTGVVAGAVGIATLIYGLAGSSRGARSSFIVAPVVTAQGGSLQLKGSF